MPTQLETDTVHTIAIDATERFYFRVNGEKTVNVNLDGEDTFDYEIDVTVDDANGDPDTWFDVASDTGADTIRGQYTITEDWVALNISTAAATGGTTADICVSGSSQ